MVEIFLEKIFRRVEKIKGRVDFMNAQLAVMAPLRKNILPDLKDEHALIIGRAG